MEAEIPNVWLVRRVLDALVPGGVLEITTESEGVVRVRFVWWDKPVDDLLGTEAVTPGLQVVSRMGDDALSVDGYSFRLKEEVVQAVLALEAEDGRRVSTTVEWTMAEVEEFRLAKAVRQAKRRLMGAKWMFRHPADGIPTINLADDERPPQMIGDEPDEGVFPAAGALVYGRR